MDWFDGLVLTHVCFVLSHSIPVQGYITPVDPSPHGPAKFQPPPPPQTSSMVLQPKTLSKRLESENAPPTKGDNLASRTFRASFHAAASRRRARNNASKQAKYTIEQAKRRSMIKSPTNIIRMSFPVGRRTPSPVADVEMKDAPPPTQPSSTSIPVTFPLYLGRPEFAEVPKASIAAIDPELAKTDLDYIRDTLMAGTMGPRCVVPLLTITYPLTLFIQHVSSSQKVYCKRQGYLVKRYLATRNFHYNRRHGIHSAFAYDGYPWTSSQECYRQQDQDHTFPSS